MDTDTASSTTGTPTTEQLRSQLKSEQCFSRAVPAGIATAVIGAIIWAVVVVVTNMELGIIAVAMGALIGIAIKKTGKGVDAKFGYLGAACAAFGWVLGTALSDVSLLAHAQNISFQDALFGLDPDRISTVVAATFQPMDLLFLAIAVYEGYKFSFRARLKG